MFPSLSSSMIQILTVSVSWKLSPVPKNTELAVDVGCAITAMDYVSVLSVMLPVTGKVARGYWEIVGIEVLSSWREPKFIIEQL
mmetsp:Transcript_28261/g.34413  ORF Transcript_28261/g.34413 Transcript_28261/m.34413 type:complete len:84 (-) Transcript_28261:182-433(-)